jgi:hypothetical protein
MKKSNFIALGLLALALSASPALAGSFSNGRISFEMPPQWRAELDPADGVIQVYPPDNDYVIALTIGDSGGSDAQTLAVETSRSLNGSTPKKSEEGYGYNFSAITDGVDINFTVSTLGPKYLMVSHWGDFHKYGHVPYLLIAGTLNSADQAEQALFDSLPRALLGGDLVVKVPPKWKAAYDQSDDSISLVNAAVDCSVNLAIVEGEDGADPQITAADLARHLNGSTPVPEGATGRHFTFKVIEGGDEIYFNVYIHQKMVLLFAEAGETEVNQDDITLIWDSLGSTNPAKKALIDDLFNN